MNAVTDNLGFLAQGLLTTVVVAILSFTGALLLGTALGVARVSAVRSLRTIAMLYVAIVRNTPVLLLLIVLVFVLPSIDVVIDLAPALVLGLTLYFASYVCEIVRSGVATVGAGQMEAALSLGLSQWQAVVRVIAPQTFRVIVQPLGTLAMAVTMATSIGAVVGVRELAGTVRLLNGQYANAGLLFGVAALLYIVLALLIARLAKAIENRVQVSS